MGQPLSENNFYPIILGSLPSSYDPYISAINATSSVLGKTISSDDLILTITEEYEHQNLKNKNGKRMKMSPFTLMMPKRVKKEVRTRKIISSAIIARKKVIINQSAGLQEAIKKDKVLRKKGKKNPRQKKLPEQQKKRKKRKKKTSRLRKHG